MGSSLADVEAYKPVGDQCAATASRHAALRTGGAFARRASTHCWDGPVQLCAHGTHAARAAITPGTGAKLSENFVRWQECEIRFRSRTWRVLSCALCSGSPYSAGRGPSPTIATARYALYAREYLLQKLSKASIRCELLSTRCEPSTLSEAVSTLNRDRQLLHATASPSALHCSYRRPCNSRRSSARGRAIAAAFYTRTVKATLEAS